MSNVVIEKFHLTNGAIPGDASSRIRRASSTACVPFSMSNPRAVAGPVTPKMTTCSSAGCFRITGMGRPSFGRKSIATSATKLLF